METVVITILLLIILNAMIIIYLRKYLKLKNTYLEARNVVESIILSFNRQLKTDELLLSQLHERIDSFKDHRDDVFQKLNNNVEDVKKSVATIKTDIEPELENLKNKIEDVVKSNSDLKMKFEEIHKMRMQDSEKEGIDSAIPIKATKALEPLTETELLVLKTLTSEGEKSSSQIKEKINLTREHSARLLKKLYEEGYLERDVKNKPYKYRVKNEMVNILKD